MTLSNKDHRLRDSKLGRVESPGFFSAFNIPFESNALINRKENIFYARKENSIHNIVRVLMFQQLLAKEHHKLRDSKSS